MRIALSHYRSIIRRGNYRRLQNLYSVSLPIIRTAPTSRCRLTECAENDIEFLVVIGLATDFCVLASVRSALATSNGRWKTYVVREGVRGVDAGNSEKALERLGEEGAIVVGVDEVAGILRR